MKIFIGTYNIASQLNDWEYGFNKNGCKVSIGSFGNHTHLVEGEFNYLISDYYFKKTIINSPVFNKIYNEFLYKIHGSNRRKLLRKLVKEYDVFFFVWESILDNFDDFEIIKAAGKKIVVVFVGDDIRWEPAMKQEFRMHGMMPIEYTNYDRTINALNKKLMYLRKTEKYADLIYSLPNQSHLALREYMPFFQLINLNDFNYNSQQRKKPLVTHFPSDSLGKGSKYVYDSISKINNNIPFDFESTGQSIDYGNQKNAYSYSDIKLKYLESDILIGQLLCPGGGKQERELLASGKVVMSNMSPHYEKHLPLNNPIIDVNPSNLTDELEKIILDHKKRQELADVARDYVDVYHNPVSITAKILEELYTNDYQGYTYKPTFFRQDYIPENEEYSKLYNKWTEFVSKEEWYTRNIPPGERSGLIF